MSVKRETLATSIAVRLEHELHNMISEGRLGGGERLPSVRDLTSQFGVSRNTVQAAIRGLAKRGLVQSLPRQGTVVLPRDDNAHKRPSRRARQIGVIDILSSLRFDDEDTETWYQGVIRGAEYALARSDYHLVKAVYLQQEHNWLDKVWKRIDGMSDGMAGVVLYADIASDALLSGLDTRGIPWVTIGRRSLRSVHNFVAVDHISLAQLFGWAFARLDYRKILYLGWDSRSYFADTGVPAKPDEKFMGLVQGYVDGDGESSAISFVRCAKPSIDAGYEQTKRFMDQHGAPQGIMAFNDHLSLGAMRALKDRGIEVPAEAGVVGTVGMSGSEYADPPLTVGCQPIAEMGRQVAQLLLEMIRGEVCRISGRFVSDDLVLRDSLLLPEALRNEMHERHSVHRKLSMKVGL